MSAKIIRLVAISGTLKINNMKRVLHQLALLFAVFSIYPNYASGDTIPDSTQIHGIWNIAGSPYVIMGLATIPADSTLTIEPGVLVEFRSSTNYNDFIIPNLKIGWIKSIGKLVALGSENDSIIFTSMGEGNWGGIHFLNSYDASQMKYCKVERCQSIGSNQFNGEEYLGGLTFENANARIEFSNLAQSRIGIAAVNSDVILYQNRINNNFAGVHYLRSTGKVTSNQFTDNNDYGIATKFSSVHMENNEIDQHLTGIFSYESSDTIIENIVRNNLREGIHIAYNNTYVFRNIVYNSGSGIRCSGSPRIVNNTIVFNNSFGIYCDYPANIIFLNNIIYGNDSFIKYHESYKVVFAHNLLQVDTVPSGLTDAGGNIFNESPMFFDIDNEDFSLIMGSPGVNSGVAYYEWDDEILLDLEPAEYFGNAPDMGAIEYYYTGIESELLTDKELQQVFVYPNPVCGETMKVLYVETEIKCDYLIILNVMGSVFHKQKIHDANNIININNWSSGIYFVIVFNEGKQIEQKKLVIL